MHYWDLVSLLACYFSCGLTYEDQINIINNSGVMMIEIP